MRLKFRRGTGEAPGNWAPAEFHKNPFNKQ